uniref:Uncharacterized protein n=1 Tax=Meloidogyne floridensis TaxID=298350 RepID=A0A915PDR3_9BILA
MPLEKRRNALSFNSINNQLNNNNKILTKSYKELNNILNDCPQSEEEFPTTPSTSENFGLNFVGHFYSPNNFNYYNTSTSPFPLIHSTSVANLQKSLQTKNLINNQIPQSLKISFPLFNSSIPSFSYQNLPSSSGFQIEEEETLIEQKTRLFNYKQENYPYNQEKVIIEAILTSPQALVISGLLPRNILEDAQFWDQWLCQLSTSLNTTQWQKFWHQYASIFEKVFEGNNNLLQLNCDQQQSTINGQLNGYIYGILCKKNKRISSENARLRFKDQRDKEEMNQ